MRKKSDARALAWMREVCLALPGSSEGVHYGEVVFKAGGKLFASCGDKRGPRTIVVGLAPGHCAEVLARNPRFRRYPYGKRAIMIDASDVDDWREMRAFVEESYRLFAGPAAAGGASPPSSRPLAAAKPRAARRRAGGKA